MKRLWVVECQFKDGQWGICDFVDFAFTFTNFYDAHTVKESIQKHLHGVDSKIWTKKRFRVREYIGKRKRK